MIEGMVDGLAARLADQPDDLDGWLRLARAYVVLGRQADARAALDSARDAFTGRDDPLARIEAAARELGLGS
jgi:cytochrome c-type biogenesis protein CcmH